MVYPIGGKIIKSVGMVNSELGKGRGRKQTKKDRPIFDFLKLYWGIIGN